MYKFLNLLFYKSKLNFLDCYRKKKDFSKSMKFKLFAKL